MKVLLTGATGFLGHYVAKILKILGIDFVTVGRRALSTNTKHIAADILTIDSFCVVFDTIVEDLPLDVFPNRPWGPGDNPKTAVWEYLKSHPSFEIDKSIQDKLLITVAPDGYLKRVK